MAIEITASGTTITGDDVDLYRIMTIRRGLKFEIKTGMKMTRFSMLAAANDIMGTSHRTKRKAFEDLNARMVALGLDNVDLD